MAKKAQDAMNNGTPEGGAVTLTTPLATECKTVMIELPIGRATIGGYRFGHIDLQLDPHCSEALRILYDALATETLVNGRRIASSADAIRFLLEQLYTCYNAVGATDESKAVSA